MLDNDFIKHMIILLIYLYLKRIEVILYFRSTNGKVSERHIMTNHIYDLSISMKAINNINIFYEKEIKKSATNENNEKEIIKLNVIKTSVKQ